MFKLLARWFGRLRGSDGKAKAQGLYNEPTFAQVERLIAAAGGVSAQGGSLYSKPTYSQFERLIAALGGQAGSDVDPLFFAQYYPEGNVKSAAEFTAGIKYTLTSNTTERTAMVKPFCNTGDSENDNSNLSGRVVIPPFVDASDNGYITDDGTRYKVVGVGSGTDSNNSNENLTSVIAPSTVTNIGDKAFRRCTKLKSASIPAAMSIGGGAFNTCSSLVSVSLPAVTRIGTYAFNACTVLASVSLPAVTRIDSWAFYNCKSLASVFLPVVTRVDGHVFDGCTKLVSVSLPVATTIGGCAFYSCTSLASVSLPAAFSVDGYAFYNCTSLESVDFGATLSSVSTLGSNAFNNVPKSCKIIVPDSLHDAWIAASGWRDLYNNGNGYKFLKHSEWEYARKYEVDKKADKPATFTTGNLAALDASGNPVDSGIAKTNLSGSSVKLGAGASIGSSGSLDPLSVAIGNGAKVQSSSPNSVAVGNGAEAGTQGAGDTGSATAVGNTAKAIAKSSIAIGSGAQATATAAVQIGYSATANNEEKSLRFRDTMVVGGDGKIPSSSLDKDVRGKTDMAVYELHVQASYWELVSGSSAYQLYPVEGSFPTTDGANGKYVWRRTDTTDTSYQVEYTPSTGNLYYARNHGSASAATGLDPSLPTADFGTVSIGTGLNAASFRYHPAVQKAVETGDSLATEDSVARALQGVDAGAKPVRLYNAAGTDALDDKGQLFDSEFISGGYWDVVYVNYGELVEDHVRYVYVGNPSGRAKWVSESNSSRYIQITPDGINWSGQMVNLSPSAATGLDPTIQDQSESLAGVHSGQAVGAGGRIQFDVTAEYHPQQVALRASPYGHFALESVPDREYSSSATYAVGDLVKYGTPAKAYRCNTAITTPEDWTAAHWTEVPTVAGLLERIAELESQLAK